MEKERIKSPKTKRSIILYGKAYNDLIKEGYTNNYLLSLPRVDSNKILKGLGNTNFVNNNKILTGLDDANLVILRQTDNIYDLCRTNKNLYHLCMKYNDIKEKYLMQQEISNIIYNIFSYLNQNNYVVIYWPKNIKFKNHIPRDKIYLYFINNKFYYSLSDLCGKNPRLSVDKKYLYDFLFDNMYKFGNYRIAYYTN